MNDLEFRALVRKMRKMQKSYFRSRLQRDLITCKDLERRVDVELETTAPEKPAEEQQGELFEIVDGELHDETETT